MATILLTGATGYVGGTLLNTILTSSDPTISALTVDALVRSEGAAAKLVTKYGSRHRVIAANYDLIINVASGFIAAGALAFVRGLAKRIVAGQPAPWLLNISGCTNLGDRPITGTAYTERVWDDADSGAVYEYEAAEEAKAPYPQRTTEVGLLTLASELGVNAVSLNTPLIFGEGTGLFNKQGIILPVLMRYVVAHGYGFTLHDGANFDWVHAEDLAAAYVVLAKLILTREDRGVGVIPSGKKGILFPAVGRVLQREIFERCLDAAFDAGVLPREDTPKDKTVVQKELKEIADEITYGLLDMAEQGWAGNKAQKGTVLKQLGWAPKFLEEAFHKDFVDELSALKEGRRGYTLESCIGIKT